MPESGLSTTGRSNPSSARTRPFNVGGGPTSSSTRPRRPRSRRRRAADAKGPVILGGSYLNELAVSKPAVVLADQNAGVGRDLGGHASTRPAGAVRGFRVDVPVPAGGLE